MDRLLADIASQETADGVITSATIEGLQLGLTAGTFHFAPPQASQIGTRAVVAEFGHSPEWIEIYRDPAFRQHDPFADFVMRAGLAYRYEEALEEIRLTEDQEKFVAWIKETGFFHSLAIPAYGPFDFDNYVTVTFGRPFEAEDELKINRIIAIIEVSNRRLAQLMEMRRSTKISLSEREREVLNWIGRSKSNTDIATILNISSATVDTFVRRIFAKMEVNDRVSAVLKGVRFGHIRF